MNLTPHSEFLTYELTEAQQLEGTLLAPIQRAILQNRKMSAIAQIVALRPHEMDEAGKSAYFVQLAHLQGQIDILEELLSQPSLPT